METTTLAAIIADVRRQTDTETASPANDHITDSELRSWAAQAYRKLVDLIIDTGGDEALDILAVSAPLTAPFTLPVDFYRLVSVDGSFGGDTRQLKRGAWRNRHRPTYGAPVVPRFRLFNNAVQFIPADQAPTSITLWYVPAMSDEDLDPEVTTFNGWHEFLVADIAIYVCAKEERDDVKFRTNRNDARMRIVSACTNLSMSETQTILAVAKYDEDCL